jgi:hypothetical protein
VIAVKATVANQRVLQSPMNVVQMLIMIVATLTRQITVMNVKPLAVVTRATIMLSTVTIVMFLSRTMVVTVQIVLIATAVNVAIITVTITFRIPA